MGKQVLDGVHDTLGIRRRELRRGIGLAGCVLDGMLNPGSDGPEGCCTELAAIVSGNGMREALGVIVDVSDAVEEGGC